ncbi:MAG: hypothetical protein PHE48_02850 [Candidatus Daviesbacteria bacterium]|nr:hypothetical protein [Candidatus Daviesbacteria bacterium]
MTVVVGFKADKEAVMLSDSRASAPGVVEDKLQKILPIKDNIALGYAGDVQFANYVANMLRQNLSTITKAGLRNLLSEVQKIALSLYAQRPEPTDFMLGVIANDGEALLYVFRHPNFEPKEIKGFELIGSGSMIKDALVNALKDQKIDVDIKYIADKIFTTASGALAKQLQDDSVGGMFQIILLEKTGIRPIRYGYIYVDPDQEPDSKSIEMQNGVWTQYDHTKNHESKILKPDILLNEYPTESRFHDYKRDPKKKKPKWHLLHFITCLALKKDIGITEFNGTLTAAAKDEYPAEIEMLLALEYWGSPGDHELEFTLIKDGKSELVHKETIFNEFMPETVELVRNIKFLIDKPGKAILQVTINGNVLGRRALYFHKLKPGDKSKPDIGNIILNALAQQADDEMEKTKKPEVVFFAMCQDVEYDSLNLKLLQQSVSFYWEKYPLSLRQKVISSFRLPKGEHHIKLELVDASTKEKWEVGNKKMLSESSYMANPIAGEFIIVIPKPGIYFLNAIVNEQRLTSILFAAETSEARWSYTMFDEQKQQVKNGELLCLSKEAVKNKGHQRKASVI